MAYCDYSFYTSQYHGNVITETDFPRLAEKASNKLDAMTFDRCADAISDTALAKKIKKAVCALAEKIAEYELAERTIRESGGVAVTSVSSGSESIHYSTDAFDKNKNDRELNDIVSEYLVNTGLLYIGL